MALADDYPGVGVRWCFSADGNSIRSVQVNVTTRIGQVLDTDQCSCLFRIDLVRIVDIEQVAAYELVEHGVIVDQCCGFVNRDVPITSHVYYCQQHHWICACLAYRQMLVKIILGESLLFQFLPFIRNLFHGYFRDFTGGYLIDHDSKDLLHPIIAACFLAGRCISRNRYGFLVAFLVFEVHVVCTCIDISVCFQFFPAEIIPNNYRTSAAVDGNTRREFQRQFPISHHRIAHFQTTHDSGSVDKPTEQTSLLV